MSELGPVGVAISAVPEARRRVLVAVGQADSLVDVSELTEQLGGHPNTTRLHLRELETDGLVTADSFPAQGPGRPRRGYRVTDLGAQALRRPVNEHAEVVKAMAAELAEAPSPEPLARAIGRRWGLERGSGLREVADPVGALMDDLGFTPVRGESAEEIELHTCPLLDSAEQYPEVICAIHEGLVAGVLERQGKSADIELESFARPGHCVLRVRPDPA